MLGIPVGAAALWATFAVPNDPSRGGTGIVAVPGWLRFVFEMAVFGFATWALYDVGRPGFAAGFGGAVVFHYAWSFDRIGWLFRQ